MKRPDYPFFRFIGFADKVFVTNEPIRSSEEDTKGFSQVIEETGGSWDWEETSASRLGFLVGEGDRLTVQYANDSALQEWADANGYKLEFEAI